MITTAPVTEDTLNAVMEFDHVIEVHADGTVSEPTGIYAPDTYFYVDANGYATPDADDELRADVAREGWTLLDGFSGQYRYAGPVMHAAEYIGGGMARHILSTPGIYVACTVECIGEEGGMEEEPAGWVVAVRA